MKENPSFYAVIPATVRYDKDLSSSEKLFYAEITAMSQKEGYCWASNAYFSELFNVSRNTITRWVGNLKDSGHIVVTLIRDGNQITKREIYPINKNDGTSPQKSKGGTNKNGDTPTNKNGDDNTTRVNTTRENSAHDFSKLYGAHVPDVPAFRNQEFIDKYTIYANEFQESRKKTISPYMAQEHIDRLFRLYQQDNRNKPVEVLAQSIAKGHTELYALMDVQFANKEEPKPTPSYHKYL